MRIGAAQFLRGDDLPGGRLDQRRSGKKNRALALDDDALVGHRRHIGAPCGTAAHDAGDLGNAGRGHLRLVIENPAEVVLIGKHLGLVGQVRTAGIHQINAR